MGKVLRFNLFYRIIVLLLVSGHIGCGFVYAQISVTSIQSFEISFTDDETQRSRAGVQLSLQDPLIKAGSLSRLDSPARFTSAGDRQNGLYFTESQGELALGSYYHGLEDRTLAQLLLENETGHNIGSLSIAFDFIFLPSEENPGLGYQLSFRVNKGAWKEPAEGRFSSGFLKNDTADWSTFSMQIALNDLYLRMGDLLELRWRTTGAAERSEFVPIALQKIELFPEKAESRSLRPGSIIISEILPYYETESGYAEYVELYNSTDTPVNLKGFTLSAGEQSLVVQSDLIAEPYSAVVVAGSGGEYKLSGDHVYAYSGRLLSNLSGRLDVKLQGSELARALYEASEPGMAYRLTHLENAYDGYSGMSHFEPVRKDQQERFPYRPGNIKDDRKLFTKTISEEGWHIIQPPGTISEDLSREIVDSLKPIFEDSTAGRTDSESSSFLYYHSEEEKPITLYSTSEAETAQGNKALLSTPGIAITNRTSVSRLVDQKGRQAFPAMLTWNQQTQDFDLIWNEHHLLTPWEPYFISSAIDDSYRKNTRISDEEDSEVSVWTGLSRYIKFTLQPEQENVDKKTDSALIGFWDSGPGMEPQSFNLPKIWSPKHGGSSTAGAPMVYLGSANSEYSANSYVNAQISPSEVTQIGLGYRYSDLKQRYQISWAGLETLPDHWEIQFMDTEIDELIDMRREQSYTFFDRSEEVHEGMGDPDLSFTPVESTGKNRFVVRISANGFPGIFENEDESPESIELKQNYPNPFNPATTIAYYLPKATDVKIGVYNVVGQQVGLLKDERMSAGNHTVVWNAIDMPSGVYIVQLETPSAVQTRKITLIK